MKLIEIGKNVHTFFERINFIDNKLPYIEDNYYKEKLTKFLNSDFMNKYKEYKKYQTKLITPIEQEYFNTIKKINDDLKNNK